MDPHVSGTPHPEFSRRMFTFGEEQVGIRCIEEGFSFSNSHFTGGATKKLMLSGCVMKPKRKT
ncbi:unnamed protein product [Brassica oleracea var. botrytis]